MTLQTRDVFERLGFESFRSHYSYAQPGYIIPIGRHRIEVAQFINKYFTPVFSFSGIIYDGRSLTSVESEILLEVDSFEQGVALIACVLGQHFGKVEKPQWLLDGEGWADQLQWRLEAAREAALRAPLASCTVSRDWLRLANKELRVLAELAAGDELARFDFDGQTLTITIGRRQWPLAAMGAAWSNAVQLKLSALTELPKRLMSDPVPINVWANNLGIGDSRFALSGDREGTA